MEREERRSRKTLDSLLFVIVLSLFSALAETETPEIRWHTKMPTLRTFMYLGRWICYKIVITKSLTIKYILYSLNAKCYLTSEISVPVRACDWRMQLLTNIVLLDSYDSCRRRNLHPVLSKLINACAHRIND